MWSTRPLSLYALSLLFLAGCGCQPTAVVRIDAVAPARGPLEGGTQVVIAGAHFPDDVAVSFDELPALSVTRISSTAIRAVAPPHALGWADVRVSSPTDVGGTTREDAFFYASVPHVTSILPAHGPASGGTSVVIVGDGFVAGTTVAFGDAEATDVVVVSDTMITAVSPDGSAGPVLLTLTNPYGETTLADEVFTYDGGAVVTGCGLVGETVATATDDVPGHVDFDYDAPLDPASCATVSYATAAGLRDARAECVVDGQTLRVTPRDAYGASHLVLVPAPSTADETHASCAPHAMLLAVTSPSVRDATLERLRTTPLGARQVVIYGDYAIVSHNAQRALQWYRLSGAAEGPVGVLPLAAFPEALHVRGDRLFVGLGRDGVVSFALDATTAPGTLVFAPQSWFGTPGRIAGLASFTSGARTYLVVADGAEGARLYDVTDPAGALARGLVAPRTTDGSTPVRAVDTEGTLVAFADGTRVGLVDVTNPLAPTTLWTRDGAYQTVDLDQGRLFAGRGLLALDLFDLAVPAAPVLTDTVFGSRGSCTSNCIDQFLQHVVFGDRLYVAGVRGMFLEYALVAPTDLVYLGARPSRRHAYGVAADATHLVGIDDTGLVVFDPASAIAAPPTFETSGSLGDAIGITLGDDFLYAAAGALGLMTYGIDAVGQLALVDLDATTGSGIVTFDHVAHDVVTSGSRLLLADARAGIDRFDLGTLGPGDPTLVQHIVGIDQHGRIDASGDLVAACADNAGVFVFSLATGELVLSRALPFTALPTSPLVQACSAVRLDGTTLYVGSVGMVTALDLVDPANPSVIGVARFPAGDPVSGLAIAGDRLFVTTSRADADSLDGAALGLLRVYDVSDPGAPAPVFVSDDLGSTSDVRLHDGRIYVATTTRGIQVFTADPPYAYLGDISALGAVQQLESAGETLYVSARNAGVFAVPLRVAF